MVVEVGHVKVSGEINYSRFGEGFEPLGGDLPLLALRVEEGAVGFLAGGAVLARIQLEVVWVVLLLLPAVRLVAGGLLLTALLGILNELPGPPVGALLFLVQVDLGFPSVVLPVVGEHAFVSLMFVLVVGAPDGLEVEHVEVVVSLELVDQLDGDLLLRVGETAELPVLALVFGIEKRLAELSLVLVRVVELLHLVVALLAVEPPLALLVLHDVGAEVRGVEPQLPPLVFFFIVVPGTLLEAVLSLVKHAGVHLENG